MPRSGSTARLLARENERTVKLITEDIIPGSLFQELNSAMMAFGPFEPEPNVAVAVSGGSDSMALALLVDLWARSRGGRITALTVDHGLRDEANVEAQTVKTWMGQHRIEHQTLYWLGKKPKTRIQSRARAARYRLIDDWCRDHHVLHVVLGHTADDQAETYLMRRCRQSHSDGLAAMSAIRELNNCRLLRPLLRMRREDLRIFLARIEQNWFDDPTNLDRHYGRTKVRNLISSGSYARDSLCCAARSYGQKRISTEKATDRFIASACRLDPAGYIIIDRLKLRNTKSDIVIRVLGRAIASIGGNWHLPRYPSLAIILDFCVSSNLNSKTLGGCQIVASSAEVMICREARNLPAAMELVSGASFLWDGRICVRVGRIPEGLWHLGAVPSQKWSEEALNSDQYLRWRFLPKPVRASLPVLSGPKGIFSSPLLAYNGFEFGSSHESQGFGVQMSLRLRRPLSLPEFYVANWL